MNGLPHGLGSFDSEEFRGFGHMVKGEFHGGPSLFVLKSTGKRHVHYMHHGRREGFWIEFYEDGQKANVLSKKDQMDVSGWTSFCGSYDKGRSGQGKLFTKNG